MKVYEIIKNAYICAGINSAEINDEDPGQIVRGLNALSLVLAEKNFKTCELPYFDTIEVNAVQGQSDYFLQNMYTLETMTFNIGDVRYSMKSSTRRIFKGETRQENVKSLPTEFYYERTNGGLTVSLYFLPVDSYLLKFNGLKGFGNYTLDDELTNYVDLGYQSFIIYQLAIKLCIIFIRPVPQQLMEELRKMEKSMSFVNPPDMTFRYISSVKKRRGGANTAFANPFYSPYK